MSDTRITWRWIIDSLLPAVVADAQRAGVDTEGWAFFQVADKGKSLIKRNPAGGVAKVIRHCRSPRHAQEYLEGMRAAFGLLPADGGDVLIPGRDGRPNLKVLG